MDGASIVLACLMAGLPFLGGCAGGPSAAPVLARTIALPEVGGPADRNGIAGRLDHLAYDAATHRLFLAAFSKGSLEVIDLDRGIPIKTFSGIAEAQGVALAPAIRRVFVSGGDEGKLHAFDARTLETKGSVFAIEDADNVRTDRRGGRVLVGGGSKTGGAVVTFDAATLARVGEAALPSHAESFQLDPGGPRMFVNVPGDKYANHDGAVRVIDRDSGATIANWTVEHAARNFPMALDAAHGRLFVVSRKPARATAFATSDGAVLGTIPCAADSDDAFYDAKTHRLFVIGGGRRVTDQAGEPVERDQPGSLDVISVDERGQLAKVASLPLPPHARTGLFVPERRALYVAVPIQVDRPAEIREYLVKD